MLLEMPLMEVIHVVRDAAHGGNTCCKRCRSWRLYMLLEMPLMEVIHVVRDAAHGGYTCC